MDKERHRQQRQSSLPSSLIPHLFSGPQQPRFSQTRTTLQSEDVVPTTFPQDREQANPLPAASSSFPHHQRPFPPLDSASVDTRDRHLDRRLPYLPSTPPHRVLEPPSTSFSQQYGSPIYSDPMFHSTSQGAMVASRSQTYSLPPLATSSNRQAWREGEAGPSSLMRPVSDDVVRGSNQTLRVDSGSSGAYRSESPMLEGAPAVHERFRHRGERDAYISSSDHSWPGDYHPFQTGQRLPGPGQLFEGRDKNQSPSYEESQERYSIPGVGSLSISAPTASYVRGRSSEGRSVDRSEEVGSNDGEGSQKGKRRREESVETDDNAKKSRNPRKTAVACNFCRGRKLRCNGEKPSCYNCTVRKFECEYVPVQRRRGPGKAPKGSRTKKGGRMETKGSGDPGRASAAIAEHELDSLAPEVRPYMTVLSLNSFGFQPPPRSPQYPSGASSEDV